MEVTKLERFALVVTLLTLAAMLFYFLGSNSAAAPVTVAVQEKQTAEAVIERTENPDKAETASGNAQEDIFPIDLNTATEAELMLLPGIGEVRAKAIVDHREANGPFTYVEDLREVKGIGEGILQQVMDYVTIGEADNG